MILQIKTKPAASPPGITKESENQWTVRVKEPAENGRATEAVIKLIARELRVPVSSVKLIKGHTSRNKIFKISE